jgi:hypothetical protein
LYYIAHPGFLKLLQVLDRNGRKPNYTLSKGRLATFLLQMEQKKEDIKYRGKIKDVKESFHSLSAK